MAKGAEAKAYATEKIKEIFGPNFLGEYDKKLYINCPEAGGMVQVAIALTCPKVPIGFSTAIKDGGMDFENMGAVVPTAHTVEITEEETKTIQHLLNLVT